MNTPAQRMQISAFIFDHEAAFDAIHHLRVHYLKQDDGGGSYEVAGINERYHPNEAKALADLIASGKFDDAAQQAKSYIALQTDHVTGWTKIVAIEAFLRDCSFNRGPHGSARILQRALNVTDDGYVGSQTLAALASLEKNPSGLLLKLRAAREQYERDVAKRDESSEYWKGLVNRWNDAIDFSKTFLPAASPAATAGAIPLAPAVAIGNFYEDVIKKDSHYNSIDRVADIELLEPKTREAVKAIIEGAKSYGYDLMVYETYRSQARQQELFKHGASKLRTVGVHHYGLACDLVKRINGEPSWKGSFAFLGDLAKQNGLVWGGNWGQPNNRHTFVDDDHVQRCTLGRQALLFAGKWYPDDEYDPYSDGAT